MQHSIVVVARSIHRLWQPTQLSYILQLYNDINDDRRLLRVAVYLLTIDRTLQRTHSPRCIAVLLEHYRRVVSININNTSNNMSRSAAAANSMPPPPPSPGAALGAEFMNMSWSAHLSPLPPLFMGGIGLFGTGDDGMGGGSGNGGMMASPLGISLGNNGELCDEIDADPIIDRATVTSSGGLGDWPGSGRRIPPPPPSPDPIAAALPVLNGGSHRQGAGTRATGAAVTWNVAPPGTIKTDRVTKVKTEHHTPVASPPGRKRRARVARMAAGTACVVCHTQKTKCDGRRYDYIIIAFVTITRITYIMFITFTVIVIVHVVDVFVYIVKNDVWIVKGNIRIIIKMMIVK
jgi:hypothetical protein